MIITEGGIIMRPDHSECNAEIGSVTQAMKAQAALSAAAIPSEIIKNESKAKRGCVYSVAFPCAQTNNARIVLEKSRIYARHWNII